MSEFADPASLQLRAEQARLAFQYPVAIDLYTQALDASPSDAVRLDLLLGRASCYEAIGQTAARLADTEALTALAEREADPSRRITARLARVRALRETGQAADALPLAEAILGEARVVNAPALEAASLETLGRVHVSLGDSQQALPLFQRSLELRRAAGDRAGEADSLRAVGIAQGNLGSVAQAVEAFRNALTLYRNLGDRRGTAQSLGNLGIYAVDIAERREYLEQALETAKELGDRAGEARQYNNIGLLYSYLGLYQTAVDYGELAVQLTRELGLRADTAIDLESLARYYQALGRPEAQALFEESQALGETVGDRTIAGFTWVGLGKDALQRGAAADALALYEKAAERFAELGFKVELEHARALQGAAQLALGRPAQALALTEPAVATLRAMGDQSSDFPPQEPWWWHYQALRAMGPIKDAEARGALGTARGLMMAVIANISDAGLRRNYLNKVPVNAQIVKEIGQPVVPSARAGDLQARLRRMITIGLRLNEQRSAETLLGFVIAQIVELTGAERALLVLVDDLGRRVPAAAFGLSAAEQSRAVEVYAAALDDQFRAPRPLLVRLPGEICRMVAPLQAHGRAMGVLLVENAVLYEGFDDGDLDLFSAFANQSASALENARLYQGLEQRVQARTTELQQRVSELAIINSVQAGLASKLEFTAIIDLVGDKIRDIFQVTDMAISLYDAASGTLDTPYYLEHGDRFDVPPSPLGRGLSWYVVEHRQPLVINRDFEQRQAALGLKLQLVGDASTVDDTQSILVVPILAADAIVGIIRLYANVVDAFPESSVNLLSTLAASLGVALENARLFDETQRLFKAEQQRTAELEVINSVQSGLAAKLDFQGIVDLVGDKIRGIFQVTDMAISLYDSSSGMLSTPYYLEHGDRFDVPSGPIGRSLSWYVVEHRRPLVINRDFAQRLIDLGVKPQVVGDASTVDDTQSIVVVPILAADAIVGVIRLYANVVDAFPDASVNLLSTLAASLGVALENARLFDETQRLLKETEQRAAELGLINTVQEGLAAQLDLQAIWDLVGDKIRAVFDAQVLLLISFDHAKGLSYVPYSIEKGERVHVPPEPFTAFERHMIQTRQLFLVNAQFETRMKEIDPALVYVPTGEMPKSVLAMPLLMAGQVTGLISLQNIDREEAFSPSDVRLITTIANSLSVALENARLFAAERERAAELAMINSVGEAMSRQLDVQTVARIVGDKVREIFRADTVLIALLDMPSRLFTVVHGYDKGYVVPFTFPFGEGLSGRIVQTRQPVLTGTAAEGRSAGAVVDPDAQGGSGQTESLLGVPIIVGDKVLGVASVQSYRPYAFDQNSLRLLQTLSANMGVAIENARLFDETNRLLKETEERAAELVIINSIQQSLAAQLDIQSIYDLVGDKLHEIFDAHAVAIYTFDHDKGLSQARYIIEEGRRYFVEAQPISEFSRRIIANRQPVLVNSWDEQKATFGETVIIPGSKPTLSSLDVPLVAAGEVRGLISLQNVNRENAFDSSDVRLLTTLANSMSVALENARLFRAEQQRASELATVNTVSQAMVSQLELGALVELIGEQMRRTFEADVVYVALYDRQTGLINFPYHVEDGQRQADDSIRYGQGLTSIILESRKPLLLNSQEDYDVLNIDRLGSRSKSFLGVPILGTEGSLGAISVQSLRQANRFTTSDERLLATIAASVGAAMQNARLYQEIQRRADETAALAEIANDIAASRDLDPVLERIAQRAQTLLRVSDIAIRLLEPDGQTLRTRVALGRYMAEMKAQLLKMGEGITGDIASRGAAERIYRPGSDPRAAHVAGTPSEEDDAEGLMIASLISRGQTIGVIAVWRPHTAGLFTDAELDFLVSVGRQVAIAVESDRLYRETQRRANEMAALAEVGREISATLDLSVVLERIAERANNLLATESSAVFLPDPTGQTLRAIAAVGDIAEALKADTFVLGVGIIGDLAKRGVAEFINDTARDARAVFIPGTPMDDDSAEERLMVAPLLAGERLAGMMAVWRTGGAVFSEADLNFLTGLARQATIAIQNARLFDETNQRAAELAIINSLGQALASQVEPDAVIDLVGDKLRELFGVQFIYIALYDPGSRLISFPYFWERDRRQLVTEPMLYGGLTARILESRQPQLINAGWEKRARELGATAMEGDLPKASLGVPILVGDAAIGVIMLQSTDRENRFGDPDVRLLTTIAANLGVAIQNAQLFAETENQRQYFESLVEFSPAAIATTDLSGKVVSWNPAAARLFGYSESEALGRTLDDLIATAPEARADLGDGPAGDRAKSLTRRNRKDGSLVDVEQQAVAVRVAGQARGSLAIYHDITELQQARREAEAANVSKSAFLATMSHEIRTPMNGIIGMTGLLLSTDLTREQREFAEVIRNSGEALLSIINDILDFSKIESGRMDLESQPFDLRDCVESAMDLVSATAAHKKLDLAYVIDEDVAPAVVGDVTRLRQVLLNLLSNAMKFTETGEVVLSVGLFKSNRPRATAGDSSRLHLLHFSVRDTGIGIPADRLDRLFQSFSQLDSSTARKYGGTGLGLAISKRLSELMGGSMWVVSDGPGRGSTFHFTIAAAEAPVLKPRAHLNSLLPQLEGKRLLIVDDNATNRRILTLQAQKWGLATHAAATPRQALEQVRRGEVYDAAILDMHMPEMDGLGLARALRSLPGGRTLPLVLFSSLGRREVGGDTGLFKAFLTKPLKQSQLYDTLQDLFAAAAPLPAQSKPAAVLPAMDPDMAARQPLRILLAEDNVVNQMLAQRLLSQMGYHADLAANGLEVVQAVERQQYDVVLMDVQMPEMDGLEATRKIVERWKAGQRPRIVAMTANAMQGDREMCMEAGMDDYISKPIRPDELVAALSRCAPAAGRDN